MDLKLDSLDHDLMFVDNDLVVTQTESESLAQRLIVKLKTFRGEWFLDETVGIPYFQSIFGKNRSKESIDAIFKRAILDEPEVEALIFYRSAVDTQYRVFSVQFEVQSSNEDEPTFVTFEIGGQ